MAQLDTYNPLQSCNKEKIGSFSLTKKWIEKAEDLSLSASAVAVMTALLWHFNPEKKYVFPHQATIAKRVKRSVITVKRAIAELKKEGFLISSRTKNGNLYAFTKKFFDTLEGALCTVSTAHHDTSMKEHVKEQKKNNSSVVFLKDFSKTKGAEKEAQKETGRTAVLASFKTHFDLEKIPDILKKKAEKGEIKNLKAYWRSLRPQIKQEYWEKETAEKIEAQRKIELEKQKQAQKEKEERERQERLKELEKPLNERFTRAQAIEVIRNMRYFLKRKNKKEGLAYDLAEAFGLDVESVLNQEPCNV